jgi:hypothetical protein
MSATFSAKHDGPPLILANVAAMINEAASAASSLSAGRNIYIRWHVFTRNNLDESYHIMLRMRSHVHTWNGLRQ